MNKNKKMITEFEKNGGILKTSELNKLGFCKCQPQNGSFQC
ncbi:hypothetical protein TICRE_13280 [Tissierella creatinophila DSM 6911]|uniref:Uncharacterized protein n=1 Tax=Tissierella creatinophila DSM 6911 TaxID=1123403 RepID=A0A1U7M5T7_TISCR|nr:hypothetical protein TICRE_13280 [Tissierella creatinophila DSM 6911]